MYFKNQVSPKHRFFSVTRALRSFLLAGAAALLVSGSARAVMVDLTQPNSGGAVNTFYGTAHFTTDTSQPTGTGVFEPFLTIERTGVEQGYNSSNRNAPFDVKRIPQWNHEFTVGDMKANAAFTFNGERYYRFLIDINEPNALNSQDNKPLISLDSLKMFTSATAGQTTQTIENLGTKRFDLDLNPIGLSVDNWLLYDDANHGSGQSDIAFLIPAAPFDAAADSDFVYMYQKFGEHVPADVNFEYTTEGGYEETRFAGFQTATGLSVIPEAGTAAPLAGMLLLAVGGECFRRRRRAVA